MVVLSGCLDAVISDNNVMFTAYGLRAAADAVECCLVFVAVEERIQTVKGVADLRSVFSANSNWNGNLQT